MVSFSRRCCSPPLLMTPSLNCTLYSDLYWAQIFSLVSMLPSLNKIYTRKSWFLLVTVKRVAFGCESILLQLLDKRVFCHYEVLVNECIPGLLTKQIYQCLTRRKISFIILNTHRVAKTKDQYVDLKKHKTDLKLMNVQILLRMQVAFWSKLTKY